VRQGDQPPNSYKDNAPKQKQPNYNLSTVNAVSGGKYIPITNQQLTGNGVNQKEKIVIKIKMLLLRKLIVLITLHLKVMGQIIIKKKG